MSYEREIGRHSVQSRFKERAHALGGVTEHFKTPARRFVPDFLVSWPGGHVEFVECKAPGKKPNAGQLRDHKRRREMGFKVTVLDSKEAVDKWSQRNQR